jgi:hypothetical protein
LGIAVTPKVVCNIKLCMLCITADNMRISDFTCAAFVTIFSDFIIYNNCKNHIINNKSDKSKILNLRMAARHCQWRGTNVPLSVASLCKRVTVSDIFV